jgi:hypothetical protein
MDSFYSTSALLKEYRMMTIFEQNLIISESGRDWPTNSLSYMLLYLHEVSYMFWQNNDILKEQLGSFLSYFNVNTVGGKSWNVWYRPMYRRVHAGTSVLPYVPWLASYHTDVEVTQKGT